MNYELLNRAVDRAARIATSNFPAHHDVSDVKQTIWVWIMEKRSFVNEVSTRENGEQTLVNLMVKVAQTHLKNEDAATYGYNEEDQYFYTVDLIKSILEVIFRHEDWQSFASALDAMPKAKTDPSQGGNNLASYADVKSAIEKLPEDYYNLIVWRYKYQQTYTAIGQQAGCTKEAVRQRHDRAVRAIQTLLGAQPLSSLRNGHSGRTEARNNASGVARVERDYEG